MAALSLKMKKRIISTVILVVVVLTTIPSLAGGSNADLPVWVTRELKHTVKFVSREFGFSSYFCAPVKQSEDTQVSVYKGVRYNLRGNAFLGFDKNAPFAFATVVHKVTIPLDYAILADFPRSELPRLFSAMYDGWLEADENFKLVERSDLSTFKGYPASKFFMTSKNEQGLPFCMTGVLIVVPEQNAEYGLYFMTWGPKCANQDRDVNSKYGQPFLDSFEILK